MIKFLQSNFLFTALFIFLCQPTYGMSGGNIAKPGEWDFSVGIRWMQGNMPKRCSGTFLKPNLIITAAHCVVGLKSRSKLDIYSRGLEKRSISGVVSRSEYHSDFVIEESKGIFFNDIGYIELESNSGEILTSGPYPILSKKIVRENETLTFVGSGIDRPSRSIFGYEPTTKKWSNFQSGGRQKDLFTLIHHKRASFCDADSGGGAYQALVNGAYEIKGVLVLSYLGCGSSRGYGALHDLTYSREWLEKSLGYKL